MMVIVVLMLMEVIVHTAMMVILLILVMVMTDILHLCKCTLTIVGPLVAATTSLSLYLKVL